MALPQQGGDLLADSGCLPCLVDRDGNRLQMTDVLQLLCRGERDEHRLVLVGVGGAHDSGDRERTVANRDALTFGVEPFAKELRCGGPAEDGDVLPAGNFPSRNVQPWTSASAGSVPRTCPKNWRCADFTHVLVRTPPATYCTPWMPRIASRSSAVSVVAEPNPLAMFIDSPPRVKLPALTRMMFVPADRSDRSTEARAPLPSATIAMTAATPMMTPSMVSTVRMRLRPSAREAIWMLTANRRITLSRCLPCQKRPRRHEEPKDARRVFLGRHACFPKRLRALFVSFVPSWFLLLMAQRDDWIELGRTPGRDTSRRRRPRSAATPKARTTDSGDTTVAQFSVRAIITAAITPTMMPATPPARLIATASTRNCRSTSRVRAPTRQAQADLAGPLGHRQQRDVHDPDAADQQRHRRNRRQQRSHRPARALQRGRQLLERDLLQLRDVSDHRARDAGRQAAGRQRLVRLRERR